MITIAQENTFDFGSDEYASLFSCAGATAFQHPIWLESFYKNLVAERGAEPLVMTFRESNKLLGVVPMIRRKKSGVVLLESTDLGVSDYAAPVLAKSLRVDDRLRQAFKKTLGKHDLIRLRPVRNEHVAAWQALFGGKPKQLDFCAHAVELTSPFDTWRAAHLDKKLSGMIARKGRRWKKQHDVEVERIEDTSKIKLAIANLARLRAGRFEGDPIQDTFVCDFYANVAVRGAENGMAETWMVTSDGEVASIVFGITHQGRFLYLLIGADYDGHGRHSPGLQMYDWIIENWLSRNGTNFDFTIGDEPFKAQFGTKSTAMSIFLIAGSLKGRLARWILEKRLE